MCDVGGRFYADAMMRGMLGAIVALVTVIALGAMAPVSTAEGPDDDVAKALGGASRGAEAAQAARGGQRAQLVAKGQNPEQAAALLEADPTAWLTDDGRIVFVHDFGDPHVDDHDHAAAGESEGDAATDEPTVTGPPPVPTGWSSSGIPIHHSNPGADITIYLDFDGEPTMTTAWGTNTVSALTIDDDPTTFDATEQAVISRTWGRIAEDFAPFDLDVTTERPAVIDDTVQWSLFAKAADFRFSPSIGGVSQFTFGYVPLGAWNPTLTFWDGLGADRHDKLADVASQENGHMFGLLHDGVATASGHVEYYGGHGDGATSWGPLLGGPVDRNVTQWSNGDYPGAVLMFGSYQPGQQDDIALIAGRAGVGFRADDYGSSVGSAAALALPQRGVIGAADDVDVFALPAVTSASIHVSGFRAGELTDGGNLDVALDVLDARGAVVASVDDPLVTDAALDVSLSGGPYYLRVRPSFAPGEYPIYGSLGQYEITATFRDVVTATGFSAPVGAGSAAWVAGQTVPVRFGLSAAVAEARVVLTLASSGAVVAEAGCAAQSGLQQFCLLRVPRDATPGEYSLTVEVVDAEGDWGVPAGASVVGVEVRAR